MTDLADLGIATYRWTNLQRDWLAESLEAFRCPECGSPMSYKEYDAPHFNSPIGSFKDRTRYGAVVFGTVFCHNFGGCEYAPG